LIIFAVILILGILSITLYGIASLAFSGTGPMSSIKAAMQYLFSHPNAFWLYALLFVAYLLVSFLLILFSYPFTLIPIIGTILSFPYQLISYAFETYLGLMIIATILTYYYSTEISAKPVEPAIGSPPAEPAGEVERIARDAGPNAAAQDIAP